MAEVTLKDAKSMPSAQQPKPPMKPAEYFLSLLNADVMIPAMMKSIYQSRLRKITTKTPF